VSQQNPDPTPTPVEAATVGDVPPTATPEPHPEDTQFTIDKAHREAAKRVVLLTVFLDILGFGIIIPQLGIYAAQYGASPQVVGVLASTYSAMQFLFAPFWGRLSDRVGRRPILLGSIFGTGLGYIAFAFANSLPWLFAARFIDGVTGANISTAQAYLSDVTEPSERAKTYGIFGAIFGVGFAIGPAIGTALSHLPGIWGGNMGIGAFSAALSFLNWALAVRRLPETLPAAARAANAERHAASGKKWQIINIHGFQRAFSIPKLDTVMLMSFVSIVAFATMQGTFTLYLETKYVRPEAQHLILTKPDEAVREARQRLAQQRGSGAAATGEGELSAMPAQIDDSPFTKSMGGDFNPSEPAAPPGLSWRRVEKAIIQPRTASLVGLLFSVIGVLSLIIQGGMIGPLKKRFGEMNLVVVGTFLMACGLALVAVPTHFWGQFPVAALIALGNGISAPVLTALVSLLSPEAERGEIIGVFQSTQSLGRIIGPNIGGVLFGIFSPSAPYLAGAALMLVAVGLALRLRQSFHGVLHPTSAMAEAQ
jgi:MFS family permease